MRRALTIGLLALAVATGTCTDGGSSDTEDGVDLGGRDLGAATFPGLGEGADDVDVATWRGRPVVVNFFSSYCAPCVREMPALEAVHQAAADTVAFLGIAVNDRAEAALARAEETGVTYTLAADPNGERFTDAGFAVLPGTLVLDADGEVVRRFVGEITADELVAALNDDAGVDVEVPA